MRLFKRKPKLSVVVVFYNMQREAVRTLYSLTVAFQRNISEQDYEVIVLDSNSSQPIEKTWVEGLQSNFRYHFVESDAPTPCRALNCGVEQARADTVVCLIDGARILSPGILHYMQRAEQHAAYLEQVIVDICPAMACFQLLCWGSSQESPKLPQVNC